MKQSLKDIAVVYDEAIPIMCDNTSAKNFKEFGNAFKIQTYLNQVSFLERESCREESQIGVYFYKGVGCKHFH